MNPPVDSPIDSYQRLRRPVKESFHLFHGFFLGFEVALHGLAILQDDLGVETRSLSPGGAVCAGPASWAVSPLESASLVLAWCYSLLVFMCTEQKT